MKGKEKKIIWKRWWMIAIYVFVGLIVLGSFLPDTENNEADEKTDNSIPLTIEEQIQQDVQKVLGTSNRKDIERLMDLNYIETNKVVNIKWNLNDNLYLDWVKSQALKDVVELSELIYKKYDVELIQFMGYFPLVDKYGNSENSVVLKVSISKETANKINWDNFVAENLPNVADSYYLHPSLSN